MTETKSLSIINKQISEELKDPAILRALLKTTFAGLEESVARQAIFEGMIRGFTFKDFLEKNVYAIPYGSKYSLVTSIDYSRKIGMKSGVVGKSAPSFTYDENGQVQSCAITIKRRVGKDIGEYTAEVYFDEYTTGKNLWASKPRTMLAKVAEMHALRMACPEEMSQLYTEDELAKEKDDVEYDNSDVADDATITVHVGDDHGTPAVNMLIDKPKEELEVPEDEAEQKRLIIGLVALKWPKTDLKDAKEVKSLIADYTELDYTPANYKEIIKALR